MSNYYFFAKLLGWLFPTKEDAQKFRHLCKEIDQRKTIKLVQNRYKVVLENLKKKYKKEKIKVVFLNDTPSKWQYQTLYEEFSKNNDFEIQVLITANDFHAKAKMKKFVDFKAEAKECYDFFKKNGMKVEFAYDFEKDKPIDLKTFNPDIIFYGQPWGLFESQNIEETSKYALTCYSSYGSAITNGKNEYGSLFYKVLYKYFIDNEFTRYTLTYHSALPESIVVSGHPKLDYYLKPINNENVLWKSENKKRIIIAPHFSFYSDSVLQLGTFDKNYDFYLNYAKAHPEYEFIFKPHPRLKEDIVKYKLMTQEECNAYYKKWETMPNTQLVEHGNYFDIFKTSDLLITDCNSFLFEYLPTKRPVIRPINPNFIGHNLFGQKIVAGYYSANNNKDIEDLIDKLLVKNEDPLKEYRLELLNSSIQPKEGYSKFVIKHLCGILSNND